MRTTLSRLAANSRLTWALSGLVLLALVATTLGYFGLSKPVTLTVDGKSSQIRTFGDTVGDVLETEGLEISDRDVVVPGPDSSLSENTEVSVRFARPIELNVDGESDTLWTTATTVSAALNDLDVRHRGARLSASRGASIDRDGMALTVITPKTITVKVAKRKPVKRTVPAMTGRDALRQLGVTFDADDRVRPAKRALRDGDTVVLDRIRVETKTVKRESVPFRTVERDDDSMYEGDSEIDREGVEGLRNVTYRVVWKNGKEVRRTVVRQNVLRKPVARIERVGTKSEPAPNFAGGSGPFDRIAQCESGGNWSINTGNGYYGGLQFSLSTWRAYGGTGYPHQHSREQQIAVAQRLVAAQGGYGAWPHCGKLA